MKCVIKHGWRIAGLLLAVFLCPLGVSAATTWHVSPTGDNTSGDGTAQWPWKTVQKAIDVADAGDKILIAQGVYQENVLSAKNQLSFEGSYNATFTSRDLKNTRTVIKSPSESTVAFKVNAVSNNVSGVDFTGGKVGFEANGGAQNRDETAKKKIHYVLTSCIVSNNVTGVLQSKYHSVAVLSSLIVTNKIGYQASIDTGGHCYIYNTTFADNGTAIKRGNIYCSAYFVRNCLFFRNGIAVHSAETTGSLLNLYQNVFDGNGENFRGPGIATAMTTDVNKWANKPNNIAYVGDCVLGAAWLGSDWKPAAGSMAVGYGEDLRADPIEPLTVDLYGTAWDGSWDCGCVKSGLTVPARVSVAYASPDGDDANDGMTAATAKRTLGAALLILDANGTLYVADGTYVGPAVLSRAGMTICGESRDGVIIRPTDSALSRTDASEGLSVSAHDVTVSNVTVTAAAYGIRQQDLSIARSFTLANAVISGNYYGYFWGSGTHTTTYRNRFSRCQIRDNLCHGMYFQTGIWMDNCLIADNAWYGCFYNGTDTDGGASTWLNCNFYFVHCTFAGNGAYGFYQYPSYYIGGERFANCIFDGNATGGIYGSSKTYLFTCCFWNHPSGYDIYNGKGTVNQYATIFDDPKLDQTSALRGHLVEMSSCAQKGTNLVSSLRTPAEACSNDLEFVRRLLDKVDIGCYISPETMNELAGEGYHIVYVTGTPDGFGEPNPAYGRKLFADGNRTLDVACTLSTDTIDGVRNFPIDTGVRARYLGYEAVTDETGAKVSSDTDESYTFNLAANTTFTIKWQVENLLHVSAGKPGCMVKVNDGAPAYEIDIWVPQGKPVTVTIIPSDDWAHSAWTGDVPESVDAKQTTIIWTSDGPRTLSPTLRGVHYVSLSGSDDNDGFKVTPWRTINHAIADPSTHDWDEIKVQAGVYEESVTNVASKGGCGHLVLSGGWGANWERDLKANRTVITPPAAWRKKAPCLYMETGTNTISGFTFTGGSAGIVSKNSTGLNDSELCHHELAYLIISNNVNGIDCNSSFPGVVLVSSLVADNSGYGYRHNANHGAKDYFFNCTFAKNGQALNPGNYYLTAMTIRNCVFEANGCHWYSTEKATYADAMYTSCLGTWTNEAPCVGKTLGADTTRFLLMRTGMITAPAYLDDAYAPTANSPFLRLGENLVANSVYPFGTDLYGTLWDGEWDMGCIKSAHAPAVKAAEQYVAETGDDTNDGLTAATARRTIGAAVAALAPNGTVHVGPGTYPPAAVPVHAARIVGAGQGQSMIMQSGAGNPSQRVLAGFEILATNVIVSGFTVTNCYAGMHIPGYQFAINSKVGDCDFLRNFYGFFSEMSPNQGSQSSHWITMDRIRATDNAETGVSLGEPARLSSSLVARNARDGIRVVGGDQHAWTYCANVSVLDNGRYGLYNMGGWANGVAFVNGVVAGNQTGAYRNSSSYSGGISLAYTVLHNELNYDRLFANSGRVVLGNGVQEVEDAKLGKKGSKYARLLPHSPCIGAGVDNPTYVTAGSSSQTAFPFKPTVYLDGEPINYKRRVDCGCYGRGKVGAVVILR